MTVPAILDHPTIKVVGVGGSGCHAINRMIAARVHEVEFLAFDTDAAALLHANAVVEVGMGDTPAGAGGDPSLGRSSAAHSHKELREALQGADMIVIVAGMGGGTGTGAAPVVAQIAQDLGALTLGLITKPFTFEGNRRRRIADEGAAALKEKVDTLISVSCDRVLHLADKKLTMNMAFALADDVLRTAIQGISDTLTVPGLINLDFSDVKSVLSQAGPARMAIGRASGENRAVDAARQAISSPLLEVPIEGARGILLNIIGTNYTLIDVHEAAAIVQEAADPDANIILGAVIDDSMAGDLQVTVIATGFDDRPQPGAHGQPTPQPQGPTWPDDPPMAPVPSRVRPRAPLVPRMAAQLPPDGGQ